ncbi:MAG: helix-turn-helix domain-containing protein, partial [Actinobacteria bacterium]|nr:helix-turn-helix domain-containing protein [Actinomycetota bacterium]
VPSLNVGQMVDRSVRHHRLTEPFSNQLAVVGTRPDLSSVSREQKQQVVRMLYERGAFLFCGAVEEVADLMGVSRITIYNYLKATRREPVASTTD